MWASKSAIILLGIMSLFGGMSVGHSYENCFIGYEMPQDTNKVERTALLLALHKSVACLLKKLETQKGISLNIDGVEKQDLTRIELITCDIKKDWNELKTIKGDNGEPAVEIELNKKVCNGSVPKQSHFSAPQRIFLCGGMDNFNFDWDVPSIRFYGHKGCAPGGHTSRIELLFLNFE